MRKSCPKSFNKSYNWGSRTSFLEEFFLEKREKGKSRMREPKEKRERRERVKERREKKKLRKYIHEKEARQKKEYFHFRLSTASLLLTFILYLKIQNWEH